MPEYPASPIFCVAGRLSMVRCRGGARPSRRCTGGKCGPMLKRQWPPSLSLRGAKRRGALSAQREDVPLGCNLGKAVTFSPTASPRSGRVLRDCHVGRWPPRNDKLEGLTPQNACRKDCQPARRSLSAATFFSRAAALYNERRYRRNRHVLFYRCLVRATNAFPRLPRRPTASSQ